MDFSSLGEVGDTARHDDDGVPQASKIVWLLSEFVPGHVHRQHSGQHDERNHQLATSRCQSLHRICNATCIQCSSQRMQ